MFLFFEENFNLDCVGKINLMNWVRLAGFKSLNEVNKLSSIAH